MAVATNTGLRAQTLSEYITQFEAAYREALGSDLSLDAQTPQGQMIRMDALLALNLQQLALYVSNGLSLDTATGRQLRDIADLFGLTISPGTYTTVTLTLTGSATTQIPRGSRVRTEDADVTFAADSDIIIPGSGSVDATFTATEIGPFVVTAGTVTDILDVISGWTGATNDDPATQGKAPETEAQYRARHRLEVAVPGYDSLESIEARLRSLESVNVRHVRILVNNTGSQITVDGVNVAAHSINVIVDAENGGNSAVRQTICEEIDKVKPLGIGTTGDVQVTITHTAGNTSVVSYTQAIVSPISVSFSTTLQDGFPSDGLAQMRQNLVDYGRTLTIGEGVDLFRMNAAVAVVPKHTINTNTFTAVTKTGSQSTTNPNARTIYTLDSDDINISVT